MSGTSAPDVDDTGVAPMASEPMASPSPGAGANAAAASALPKDPRSAVVVRGQKIEALAQGLGDQPAPAPPPKAPTMAPPPKYEETSPLQAFGSVASAFAALASLTTRRPLVGALNASAAAMEATYAHDYSTWKRNYDSWKQNMEASYKDFDAQMKGYNAILANRKLNNEEKTAQISALAHLNNDSLALAQLQSGDASRAQSLMIHRENMAQSMRQHQDTVDANTRKYWSDPWNLYLAGKMDQWKAAHGGQMPGDPNVIAGWEKDYKAQTETDKKLSPAELTFKRGLEQITLENQGKPPTYEQHVALLRQLKPPTGAQEEKSLRLEAAQNLIDTSIAMIDQSLNGGPPVTGYPGMLERLGVWSGIMAPEMNSAVFEGNIQQLREIAPKLLGGAGRITSKQYEDFKSAISGLENLRDPQQIRAKLQSLKDTMTILQGQGSTGGALPAPVAPTSPQGSQSSPFQLPSDPKALRDMFNSLPNGSWVIDPSSGQPVKKVKNLDG